MAILNHAKDNRLGVWRPKQYETNGLRGADISFSISRAPIGDPPSSPFGRRFPPLFGPFGNPLASERFSTLFFSVIFPAAHLSLLNETGEADGAGALLFFSAVLLLSVPFFFFFFFCHGAPDAKKRGLFESQARDRLSSGTSKGHNSATWNFPLREVVVGVSVFHALVYGHPYSSLLPSLPPFLHRG